MSKNVPSTVQDTLILHNYALFISSSRDFYLPALASLFLSVSEGSENGKKEEFLYLVTQRRARPDRTLGKCGTGGEFVSPGVV